MSVVCVVSLGKDPVTLKAHRPSEECSWHRHWGTGYPRIHGALTQLSYAGVHRWGAHGPWAAARRRPAAFSCAPEGRGGQCIRCPSTSVSLAQEEKGRGYKGARTAGLQHPTLFCALQDDETQKHRHPNFPNLQGRARTRGVGR